MEAEKNRPRKQAAGMAWAGMARNGLAGFAAPGLVSRLRAGSFPAGAAGLRKVFGRAAL